MTISILYERRVKSGAGDGGSGRLLAQEGIADQADLTSGTARIGPAKGSNRWNDYRTKENVIQARYDRNGQPTRIGEREYVWNALGKLIEVRQEGRALARYRYSHRGERIGKSADGKSAHYLYEDRKLVAELDARGNITRQYVYLADQPIAVLDTPQGQALHVPAKGRLREIVADLAIVLRAWSGTSARIVYLHNNHLGAPELATDVKGRPIWKGQYDAWGRVSQIDNGFILRLRLPGQYEDAETGLYYNDHRYYDPAQGRYLSPDPLGLRAGLNGYAYVNGNPLKYIDPSGLILFAFDGTGNSENPPAGDEISNVIKFMRAYDETINGRGFYITGIGTTNEDMPYSGNMATGDGFDQRVALGFDFLDQFIDANSTDSSTVYIDVVGFSRGAAEARVWMNLLAGRLEDGRYTTQNGNSRCLDLRFIGLWDTVPHLGLFNGNEANYNFAIPDEVRYAAHAVALNEHRGGLANFDGHSILDTPASSSGGTRVELGFIGSHADIGGGYGTGDLSDAALMWMIEQGRKQGIQFMQRTIQDNEWNQVTNPILHDKSGNKIAVGEAPLFGDREFVYGDGAKVGQTQAVIGGNDTAWANSMVNYYSVWCGPSGAPAVGLVDMQQYSEWLKGQGVDIGHEIPSDPQPCH